MSDANNVLMQLQNVSKEYQSGPSIVRAVNDASLTLEPGEFVLLQGMSGSGKTTLLSIMGCLMKPTSGRITICGTDVTRLSESRLPALRLKHIGFIFQTFNLFPALTAFQNVTLALQLKGFGFRERRREAHRLLDLVRLSKEKDRKPSDMSGGQRQRVSIARALAGNVDVLLADEPTAALDTATGMEIMEILRETVRSGERAALIVTHDTRLERFATRVDHITDGVLTVGLPLRKSGIESGRLPDDIPPVSRSSGEPHATATVPAPMPVAAASRNAIAPPALPGNPARALGAN